MAAYLDARAWAGYSIRALILMTLGMLATGDLVQRWRRWLWTERAAFLSAAIIAGCWVYDEFLGRPALDRTVRVALLGPWLFGLALIAGLLIWAWSAIRRRLRHAHATGDDRSCQYAGLAAVPFWPHGGTSVPPTGFPTPGCSADSSLRLPLAVDDPVRG